MKAIADAGHSLGMHSFSHKYKQIYSSVEAFLDDMYQMFNQIKEATGVTPTLFRLPGGSINAYNAGIYQEILTEMLRRGFIPYDWNVSIEDATGQNYSVQEMVDNVVTNSSKYSRAVVLMHDAQEKTNTINALPEIIHELRDKDYEFNCLTPFDQPLLYSYTY